jgi:hypothetical protein
VAKLDFYFSVQYGFEEAEPDKSSTSRPASCGVAKWVADGVTELISTVSALSGHVAYAGERFNTREGFFSFPITSFVLKSISAT